MWNSPLDARRGATTQRTGLWFFRPMVKRHGAVFLERSKNLSARTTVNEIEADKVVRCAFEAADPGAPRSHCDPKSRNGVVIATN